MELVAGHAQEILIAVGTEDRDSFDDRGRFPAYLSLSGGMDPTWLDLFAEAARSATDREVPPDLIDARIELGPADGRALTVERVDPGWVSAVAAVPDAVLDALAGRWIDQLEEEFGDLPREEKPWIRELAGRVVAFCRAADRAPDVVFVWEL
ncbi:MAG TPA: hypothetical protein VFP66_14430 [Candidatus Limnocylindrales bacterium]|nr:hypothetical protein [Candidatus Limnocylindrales bacterium]